MKPTKFAGLLMSILIMLVLVVQPSFKVGALPATVYDAVLDPLPYNMPSLGFQATATSEFGDYFHLAGTNRTLQSVTVTMSNWAIYSDYPSLPSTGFTHPITINIYNAVPGAPLNTVGALLATVTETKTIPWRPVADPTCPGGTAWRAPDDNCYNGLAFNLTFDMSSLNVTLPDDIIVGVAYNTQSYGAAPIGAAGPYNSLNVAVQPGPASVGTDDNLDRVFVDSTWAGLYTDGGAGGVGIFREDTAWTTLGTVALRVAANPPPAPAVLVNPTSLDFGDLQVFNWSASQTVTLTNTGAADLHIGAITNTGDFWVLPWVDNCSNKTVIPTGTCTFDVIFTPSSTGAKTGTVSIPSDAASTPDTVALTGNGVASEIQVTPSPLAFGSRLVGSSTTLTATITNIGSADLHTGVLTITGTAFSLVNNLCDNATLIPNATCTFDVTFTPPAAGPFAGEVSIPSDSGGLVETDRAGAFQYFPVTTILPLTGTGILAQTTAVLRSNGGYDGTVREFKKDAGYGGFNEPISALISVGDDYLNRQYVGILDFNTSSIPDNAVITSVKVRVKGMILAETTYNLLGEMTADIMKPYFGTGAGLENLDFQAPALVKNVGTFTHAPTYYKWITMNVKPAAFSALNLKGTTQFRLHFQTKYFDNNIKEMLRFLSGDFWIPTDFPMLVVTYYVP